MVSKTVVLSVPLPAELKTQMDRHKEIKWVHVARFAIAQKVELLNKMDDLFKNSTFTEKDALRHGRQINRSILGRHRSFKT